MAASHRIFENILQPISRSVSRSGEEVSPCFSFRAAWRTVGPVMSHPEALATPVEEHTRYTPTFPHASRRLFRTNSVGWAIGLCDRERHRPKRESAQAKGVAGDASSSHYGGAPADGTKSLKSNSVTGQALIDQMLHHGPRGLWPRFLLPSIASRDVDRHVSIDQTDEIPLFSDQVVDSESRDSPISPDNCFKPSRASRKR